MNVKKKITPAYVLIFLVSLGYMVGVLNTYHRFPSTGNIYPNLVVIMIGSLGLLYWYGKSTVRQWSLSVVAWLLVFLLIVIQPFINTVAYPESMIFDLSVVLFCIALSLCIANIESQYQEKLFQILVYFLVITALLTVVTQLAQYLKLDLPRALIFPNFSETRIGGNLSQPNQAAFVMALGVAGLLYLANSSQRFITTVLFITPIAFLALGLGLTASRTGVLLMMVALLSYVMLFRIPLHNKIFVSCTTLFLLIVGYTIGSQMLASYNTDAVALSSLERISDGTLSLRWYQLQQAIIMFNDHKLTGVGWGNLLGASVNYAQELPWFSSTAHTHFFVSQIAVETGVIGLLILLPFAYILLTNFSFTLSNYQAAIYSMLAVFVAYSCSEFPLWIPMFLIVFVTLLSLIDTSGYSFPKPLWRLNNCGFLIFSMLMLAGSVYYQVQYRNYSKVYYALMERTFTPEEKVARLSAKPQIFGFGKFDDTFLFYLMSEDKVGLEYKTQLADKVLTQSVSYYFIAKSANIHLLAGNRQRALELYKAACVFKSARECVKLSQQMSQNAEVGSEDLKWVNMQFQKWRKNNPSNTGNVKS
ncbi:O-antigen ligase family protein [Psychrobacter sp. AOP29-E1-4]|uniref:O-antigen ligase family protein n=1 Tax=Psychrobacter sp. AOP29-E1-4 TaxID=3457703 RepID=UPI004036A529